MNNNNNNNKTTYNSNDSVNDLTELLSLPVNFTMDPLVSPLSVPQKRQASFSSASSVSSESEQYSSSESIVSLKKSRLSLDDKDQKTKER